jgi:hypothetical protein
MPVLRNPHPLQLKEIPELSTATTRYPTAKDISKPETRPGNLVQPFEEAGDGVLEREGKKAKRMEPKVVNHGW